MEPGTIFEVGGKAYTVGGDGTPYPNDPPIAGPGEFDFNMRDPSTKTARKPNKWPGLKDKGKQCILGHAYDADNASDDASIARHMREWGRFDPTPPDEGSYEDVQAWLGDWLKSRDFAVPLSSISRLITLLKQARKDKYLSGQPR